MPNSVYHTAAIFFNMDNKHQKWYRLTWKKKKEKKKNVMFVDCTDFIEHNLPTFLTLSNFDGLINDWDTYPGVYIG